MLWSYIGAYVWTGTLYTTVPAFWEVPEQPHSFLHRGGSDAFPEEAVSKVQRVASQAEQGMGGTGEPSWSKAAVGDNSGE